jgi:hypothetical protein
MVGEGLHSNVRGVAFALALMCVAANAHATNYPVSGTITVNANPATLPDGGTFGDSSYDTQTGVISVGKFTFPQATITFPSQIGTVTATYQLTQTNTSTGQVAGDGVAALTQAVLKLQVVSASIGVIPIGVGTCIFQPLDVDLAGTGAAAGLDLSDAAFTIPTVGASDCGGFGNQINAGIAGSNNSLQMHFAGDFTPPSGSDIIFADGFELPF